MIWSDRHPRESARTNISNGVKALTYAGTMLLAAACGPTPTYVADLLDTDVATQEEVFGRLECNSVEVVTHEGEGATDVDQVIKVARGIPSPMSSFIEDAVQVNDTLWLLTTSFEQVLGTLDSRGGVAFCVQDVGS